MDVMACSVSRTGNYQPLLDPVQPIFPERECLVELGHDSANCLPIGKQWAALNSTLTPIHIQCGAVFRTTPRLFSGVSGGAKSATLTGPTRASIGVQADEKGPEPGLSPL